MRTITTCLFSGATLALAAGLAATTHSARAEVRAAPAFDSAMTVPDSDRQAESVRLRAFGVKVPDGGLVLERPWDPPFTRRSYIVPQAWFTARVPDSVSADALAQDIPVLATVMERAYGGWETATRRGWNWAKWFADWTAMLRLHAGQKLPLIDAFAPMKELMAVQLDNHTTIPLRGARFGSGSRSVVIAGSPTAPCAEIKMTDGHLLSLDTNDPAQRPRHAQRWDAATRSLEPVTYLSIPANRGMPESIRCGNDSFAMKTVWPSGDPASRTVGEAVARDLTIRALSGAAVDEPDFKILEPAIAYLRLPTFSVQNAQIIETRIANWPKRTGAERVLIVDLRDNGGGDAALETLRGWVDMRRTQRAQTVHTRRGASCLYDALRWGYVTASTASIKPPVSASMTQRLQSSMDPLFKRSVDGCPSQFETRDGGWDYRQHTMRPPGDVDGRLRIMVLVNNGAGSDGEYMAMLLASLPEAVIVGSNTFGVAQYIQPGYSVLPHTRLPFRIALGTSDNYGDNRSFDGYGFDVDVLLSAQDDQRPENILALARYIGGM